MTEFHTGRDIRLDTSDTHKYGEILLHSDKGEICTVYPIDGNEDMPNFPLCHLIAAAPDLYDALEDMIAIMETDGRSYVRDASSKARAALAKARGEA